MTELPSGWVRKTLAEVAVWGSGGTPQAGNPRYYGGNIPWAIIGDLNDGDVHTTEKFITEDGLANSSAKLVPSGAILIAMYGSIGKMGIAKVPMATNQAIAFALPKNDQVIPRYLFWFLRSQREIFLSNGKGATQQNISQTLLKAWEIPVPPLDEQKRIVEAIDDHLSRLDKALAEIKLAQHNSRLLVMASLENVIDEGFPRVRLEDITLSSGYGTSAKCVAGGPGVPVARIPNLVNGTIEMLDEKRAQSADLDLTNLMLAEGDLLVIRTNGSQNLVGTTAVVPANILASFASYLIRFRVDTAIVDPKWVHAMFSSLEVRRQVVELSASSAGQYNLGLSKLNSISIPLPDVDAQKLLLKELDKMNSHLQLLKHKQDKLFLLIDVLRRSLLNQAFTGEIVHA